MEAAEEESDARSERQNQDSLSCKFTWNNDRIMYGLFIILQFHSC